MMMAILVSSLYATRSGHASEGARAGGNRYWSVTSATMIMSLGTSCFINFLIMWNTLSCLCVVLVQQPCSCLVHDSHHFSQKSLPSVLRDGFQVASQLLKTVIMNDSPASYHYSVQGGHVHNSPFSVPTPQGLHRVFAFFQLLASSKPVSKEMVSSVICSLFFTSDHSTRSGQRLVSWYNMDRKR